MVQAHELVLSEPTKVRFTLIQEEGKSESHNVVAEIKGSTKPEEVICFSAHYDSVRFSTGAYDNGTGSITILELFRYFCDHKPKRTMKFIWCGSEEVGLLGSTAYCNAHKEELNNYVLNINIDMTGVVLGMNMAFATCDNCAVEIINSLSKEVGFTIRTIHGVAPSDSTPFADNNVPAITFNKTASRGGARIHSRQDVIKFLDSKNFYETCGFIETFVSRMDNSVVLPIPKAMPEKIRKDLDKYLGK